MPFVEESIMRGFFYRAFRGSYSVAVSTLLVVAIALATHWTQDYRSWVALIALGAGNVLFCFLRERSDGLWDCILCHFVYNATVVWAAL
jgi:membrane protease YdiL (CAAX protease family)